MKKIYYLIACLLCISPQVVFCQTPQVVSFNLNKSSLKPYEHLEITIKLDREVVKYYDNGNKYDNLLNTAGKYRFPHNDTDVIVKALITKPGNNGYGFQVNGYYNQDFYYSQSSCTERININGIPSFPTLNFKEVMLPATRNTVDDNWKIRYTPDTTTGLYMIRIAISDKYSFNSSGVRVWRYIDTSFLVTGEPVNDGFVRILEGRHRYLYREKSKNFIYLSGTAAPLLSVGKEYSCSMLNTIQEYKDNNINFVRVWIDGNTPNDWFVKFNLIGYDPHQNNSIFTRVFNQMNAKRLDTIFSLFEEHGITFQICLFLPNLGDESGDIAVSKSPYYKTCIAYSPVLPNNWNHPNIGSLVSPFDWYRRQHQLQKQIAKYAIARWGHFTNLVSWEIGNELLPVDSLVHVNESTGKKYFTHPNHLKNNSKYMDDTVRRWFIDIKNYIKSNDPYGHLVTTSVRNDNKKFSDSSFYKWDLQHKVNFTGQFDVWDISGFAAIIRNKMDWNVDHKYFANVTCPSHDSVTRFSRQEEGLWNLTQVNINNNDTWSQLNRMPFMIQEWGWGDDKCTDTSNIYVNKRWDFDPHAVTVHNVLWLNLFSHACGLAYHFDGMLPVWDKRVWRAPAGFFKDLNDIPDQAKPTFEDNGFYRNASLVWPEKNYATGWCQNTQFTFANLYWNHNNYLKYFSNSLKPQFEPNGKSIRIIHSVGNNSEVIQGYKITYINTLSGLTETVDTVFTVMASDTCFLEIKYPSFMKTSEFGDFAWKATKICNPLARFSFNGRSGSELQIPDTIKVSDTLFISVSSGGYSSKDSIIFEETDSLGSLIDNKLEKLIFNRDLYSYQSYWFTSGTLPLICDTQNLSLNKKYRYFNIKYLTTDCIGNPVLSTAKYVLEVDTIFANLKISDTAGNTILNPLVSGFGQNIYLDPAGTKGAEYLRYFVEEIDSANNFINRINTCAEVNSGYKKIRLNEYLSYQNVCSSITELTGTNSNPRFYRIILFAELHKGCLLNNNYKTDTTYIKINDCIPNGQIHFNKPRATQNYMEYKWYFPDSLIALIGSDIKNTTRIEVVLAWVINGNDTLGRIDKYSFGKYNNEKYFDLSNLLYEEIEYTKNHNNSYRIQDSMLFHLYFSFSNQIDGGCSVIHTDSVYINLLQCKHLPKYQFVVNDSVVNNDTVYVKPTEDLYINASNTQGSPYYSIKSSYRTTGSYINLNTNSQTYKGLIPGYDLSLLNKIIPVGNLTTTYKFELTSAGWRMDGNCFDTITQYLYAVVEPFSSVEIRLKDTLSRTAEIYFCDTVNNLPITFNPSLGVEAIKITLAERYYYGPGIGWADLRISDPTPNSNKKYWERYIDSMSPIKNSLLELNNYSQYWRGYTLDKSKRWHLTVQLVRPFSPITVNFYFNYEQSCNSILPPIISSNEFQVINKNDSLIYNDSSQFKIFPNPGDDYFNLFYKSKISQLSIYNCSGKLLYLIYPSYEGNNLYKINTTFLPSGLYYLSIQDSDGIKNNFKWIKQ